MNHCAKCGVKEGESVRLRPVRLDGEVVKLCDRCRRNVMLADLRPNDPAPVVSTPGPQAASMRLAPSGSPPLVMPRVETIEIARPQSWRRACS